MTNIGIIGLGLMGGSLGRALKRVSGYKVYAYDTDDDAMLKGALLSAYDEVLTDKNAKELDILIMAVTPSHMEGVTSLFLPLLKDGALVTDMAGIKRPVIKLMESLASRNPSLSFCGGHPMTGREFSGVSHSSASLYEGASVILVPVDTPIEKLALLKSMYIDVGASGVVIASPEEHDQLIAYTSQLAHVVSSAYIRSDSAEKNYGFSAGSFRDMTRVARMNSSMWTELMLDNADNLSKEIRALASRLNEYADALDNKNKDSLNDLLETGNKKKLSVEKNRARKMHSAFGQD